jgi:hypothetical protein
MASVKVKAVPRDGFTSRRRLGRTFGAEFSEAFDVSDAEMQQLLEDPYLQVRDGSGKPLPSHEPAAPPTPADSPNTGKEHTDAKRK